MFFQQRNSNPFVYKNVYILQNLKLQLKYVSRYFYVKFYDKIKNSEFIIELKFTITRIQRDALRYLWTFGLMKLPVLKILIYGKIFKVWHRSARGNAANPASYVDCPHFGILGLYQNFKRLQHSITASQRKDSMVIIMLYV